jgi:hypothetical protein
MIITEAKDLHLTLKTNYMQRENFVPVLMIFILVTINSCKNETKPGLVKSGDLTISENPGLIAVAKNIITDIIVKPDSTGDPWEVEKVQGYDGKKMYEKLFDNIYNKKLIVYDCLTGKPLSPGDIKKIEKDYGSDRSKIGKIQFSEDWYFDPQTNQIRKEIKSVSFGYEIMQEKGLPNRYKPLFQIKR